VLGVSCWEFLKRTLLGVLGVSEARRLAVEVGLMLLLSPRRPAERERERVCV